MGVFQLALLFLLSFAAAEIDTIYNNDSSSASMPASLSQFSMVYKPPGTAIGALDFVITKGTTAPEWTEACVHGMNGTLKGTCKPTTFGIYTDVVSFEFSYSDRDLYSFQAPITSTLGGRARPVVLDFESDLEEKGGEISIWHRCERGKDAARSVIEMRMQIATEVDIVVSWVKICGGGVNERLDYGFYSPNGAGWKNVSMKQRRSVTFGPAVLSTRIYICMEDGGSLRFARPEISTNGVETELRGANFGGVVAGGRVVFDILYTCHERGMFDVNLKVNVAPFEDVKMSWRKDCGGGRARSVSVGRGRGGRDVVAEGVAVEGFGAEGDGSRVSTTWSGVARFHISIGEQVWGDVRLGDMSAHAEDGQIGMAWIAGSGGRLKGGEQRRVMVGIKCLRKGRTRVRVTIPVEDRSAVEWWFERRCVQARLSGGMGRAGGVMYASLSMFGMIVVTSLVKGCAMVDKSVGASNR